MAANTRYLVGLVIHEGRVDGQHQQRSPSPGWSFANLTDPAQQLDVGKGADLMPGREARKHQVRANPARRRAPSRRASVSVARERRTQPSPAGPKAVPGATATRWERSSSRANWRA
jgi:hypothetical protein